MSPLPNSITVEVVLTGQSFFPSEKRGAQRCWGAREGGNGKGRDRKGCDRAVGHRKGDDMKGFDMRCWSYKKDTLGAPRGFGAPCRGVPGAARCQEGGAIGGWAPGVWPPGVLKLGQEPGHEGGKPMPLAQCCLPPRLQPAQSG